MVHPTAASGRVLCGTRTVQPFQRASESGGTVGEQRCVLWCAGTISEPFVSEGFEPQNEELGTSKLLRVKVTFIIFLFLIIRKKNRSAKEKIIGGRNLKHSAKKRQ